MEYTGAEDNIHMFLSLAEQETQLKNELKKVREEKKQLEKHLIETFELKNCIGVFIKGKNIEVKQIRRKDKLFKILKIYNK